MFICWVDDRLDHHDIGAVPGELERFTAPLRDAFTSVGRTRPVATGDAGLAAAVLAGLWERTAAGMPESWRRRFVDDYTDFLDACEEEMAVRRSGARLSLTDYIGLRRRTITLLPMLNVLERTGHTLLVEHPQVDDQVRELRWTLADVVGWANDLASHTHDEAASQDSLLSLIARRDACTPAEAAARATVMMERRRAEFTAPPRRCAQHPAAHRLGRYVDLVERFMAATLHWLAVTSRFAPIPGPTGPATATEPVASGPGAEAEVRRAMR
ncbi:terpene synthase family protein [Streptomyces sp. NPDC085524]|uniref:terpene synthase family protein n=1 Tax=Streptomyces sp. NPDC085524 TaxID=3365728 RepID=UPI0037D0628D